MKKNAFTLIELIVVTAIVLALSFLLLANYRGAESQFALDRSAASLAHDLRTASSLALSTKEFQGAIPQTGYGVFVDKGWDSKKYRLYADTSDGNEFFTVADSVIEAVDIEKGVFIKDIVAGSASRSQVSVNFKAPDPVVKIRHEAGEVVEVVIILALDSDPEKMKQVIVNKAGLIYVE